MSKRSATSDINHDNWDQEEEPEDSGVFQVAPKSVIEQRVIRTAKRRISGSPVASAPKNVFSGFTAFGQFKSTPGAGVDAKTAFSFLSGSGAPTPNQSEKMSVKKEGNSTIDKDSKESVYLAKLKGLNEGLIDWIKQHVDSNPCCILTPVFRDYEKFLKEIEEDRKSSSENKPSDIKFDFGSAPDKKQSLSNIRDIKFDFGSASDKKQSTTNIQNTFTTSSSPVQTSSSLSTVPFNKPDNAKPPLSSAALLQSNNSNIKPQTPFFGNTSSTTTPFSSGSGPTSTFSFGSLNSKPPADSSQEASKEEENEEPPKNDFTAVKEDDAVFTKRVKVFIKKDEEFKDRGVGNLFIKETPNGKFQALVRADTNLGNILFNILLTSDVPTKRLGKNNVMCICLPTPDHPPPPIPVLLRVKTSEDADKLLEELDKYKK